MSSDSEEAVMETTSKMSPEEEVEHLAKNNNRLSRYIEIVTSQVRVFMITESSPLLHVSGFKSQWKTCEDCNNSGGVKTT